MSQPQGPPPAGPPPGPSAGPSARPLPGQNVPAPPPSRFSPTPAPTPSPTPYPPRPGPGGPGPGGPVPGPVPGPLPVSPLVTLLQSQLGGRRGDATGYLRAGAHLDRGFRDAVIEELMENPHRIPPPPFGIDLVAVLKECLAARSRAAQRGLAFLVVPFTAFLVDPRITLIAFAVTILLGAAPAVRTALRGKSRKGGRARGVLGLLVLLIVAYAGSVAFFRGTRFLGGRGLLALVVIVLGWTLVAAFDQHRGLVLMHRLATGQAPDRSDGAGRPAARYATLRAQQADPDVVYSDYAPFVGAGVEFDHWSFAIEMVPGGGPAADGRDRPPAGASTGTSGGTTAGPSAGPSPGTPPVPSPDNRTGPAAGTPAGPAPQTAGGTPLGTPLTVPTVHAWMRDALCHLGVQGPYAQYPGDRLHGISVSDYVFKSGLRAGPVESWTGTGPGTAFAAMAPGAWAEAAALLGLDPALPAPPTWWADTLDLAAEERLRHYLAVRVGSWNEEVVLTVFTRVQLQGRLLFLENRAFLLPPISRAFHTIDTMVPPVRASDWFALLGRALGSCAALGASAVPDIGRQVTTGSRIAAGHRWYADMRRSHRPVDHGPKGSVRELGADSDFQQLFQEMDVQRFYKSIELRTLTAVRDCLRAHGYRTDEYDARQNVVINNGVQVNGNVTGNVQSGTHARAGFQQVAAPRSRIGTQQSDG